jgi:agmatinase
MAESKRRKTSRSQPPKPGDRDDVVEIPGELAREIRPDLWDPTDPGFRLWTPRDTTGDPRREAGPFWPHRQARGPGWLGIPTFFRLPIALNPEDLKAGRVDVAIFGAPLDLGIGMRGAAYGPQAIRVSERYLPWGGSWSGVPRPHQHVRVDPFRVLTAVDYGDVAIDPFSTEHTIGHVREFVRKIAETGAIPLMIGGDHSLLWPGAAGVADVYGPGSVGVIHFDAHADAGHNMLGHLASHGTPIRRLIADDGFPGRNFIQVGLRGYYPDDETFEWMRSVGMRSHYMAEVERKGWDPVLDRALKEALDGPRYLYISLDVDVMDPAYTPGTGTPEPGGLTPRELFPLLRRLTAENRVVGIDVVEMNPLVDPGYTTGLNVNRCIREMLVGLALRKQGITTPNYLDPRAAGEAPGPAGRRGRGKRRP